MKRMYRCSFCLERLLSEAATLKIHPADVVLVRTDKEGCFRGDRFSSVVLNLAPGINAGCCSPGLHVNITISSYSSLS